MELKKIFPILPKNKKGAKGTGDMGLNTAITFFLAFAVLVILGFIVTVVLGNLQSSSGFAVGSHNYNLSQNIITNSTGAIADFFTNASTWLTLLSVVIILLIVSVVIVTVKQFGGSGRTNV